MLWPDSDRSLHCRTAVGALVVTFALGTPACGGQPTTPPQSAAAKACLDATVEACAELVAKQVQSGQGVDRPLVRAYLEKRRGEDADDLWAGAARALEAAEGPRAVVVLADVPLRAEALTQARFVPLGAAPPAPTGITADELWLAIADLTGVDHLVTIEAGGEIREAFPYDVLWPFLGGARAVTHSKADDPGALTQTVGARLEWAASMRAAVKAANAGDYVAAAKAFERLQAALPEGGSDGISSDEALLRSRYALSLGTAAGLVLEDVEDESDDAAADEAEEEANTPPVPPSPRDTPYGDLLRLRLSDDARAVWAERGENVKKAFPASRHEALKNLFSPPEICGHLPPSPMEGPNDLLFASRVPFALRPSDRVASRPGAEKLLPLGAWLKHYGKLVEHVDAAGAVWVFAPTLLRERGEQLGLTGAGSHDYDVVSKLVAAHMASLTVLQQAFPDRFAVSSLLALTYSPGLNTDAALRNKLLELLGSAVHDQLLAAKDAETLGMALLTAVMAGISYPPAVQAAHFGGLYAAFTEKLNGDLKDATGWAAAGLQAAEVVGRYVQGESVDLESSVKKVTRALEAADIEQPALASLAAAAAQYGVLGAQGHLSTQVFSQGKAADVRPDRVAARESLEKALGALGGPDAPAPDPTLLRDLTDLSDGFIAVAVVAIAESTETAPVLCSDDSASWSPSPKVKRAVAQLADVRQRVVNNAAYASNDSLWGKRARLLTTVLSDVIDVLNQAERPIRFAVTSDAASGAVRDGLTGIDDDGIVRSVIGLHALGRAIFEAKDNDAFVHESGPAVRKLLTGLAALFHDEDAPLAGMAILETLRDAPLPTDGQAPDLADTFLGYAKLFYERDMPEQGDLMLMAVLTASGVREEAPPAEAVRFARANKSRFSWVLDLFAVLDTLRQGKDAQSALTALREPFKASAKENCTASGGQPFLDVLTAINDFRAGRRTEARKALDAVLDKARADGLVADRVTYQYSESTGTRVFQLSVAVSQGAGLVGSANTFQMGLGMQTAGQVGGSLQSSAAGPSQPEVLTDTARYYVHTAAIAALFHFLEGDAERGSRIAAELVESVIRGIKLGDVRIGGDQLIGADQDARAALALVAQLAAEDGRPFLAGDILTLVGGGFGPGTTDEQVDDVLDVAPLGISNHPKTEQLLVRARRSLLHMTAQYECTTRQAPRSYDQVTCADYPVGLSLRIADALPNLPRVRAGESDDLVGGSCGALKSLDGFLRVREGGAYDPDRFTEAVTKLDGVGRKYDAAILLTRQRTPTHCPPPLVDTMRKLGRSREVGPSTRADLLSSAIGCSVSLPGKEVIDDLIELDAATRGLADPSRSFQVLLYATQMATTLKRDDGLAALAAQPDFVERWMNVTGATGASALIVDHYVALAAGKSPDLDRTKPTYELLCKTFDAPTLAPFCQALAGLRDPDAPAEARAERASAALTMITEQFGMGG